MKLKRKRELLFRILFGQSFHAEADIDREEIEVYAREGVALSEEDKDLVFKDLQAIQTYLPEIDQKINQRVERWNTKTMARVELAILRLSVYELFYKQEAPVNVIANDAVRFAADYGQDAAYRFVNGAIAKIMADLPAGAEGKE